MGDFFIRRSGIFFPWGVYRRIGNSDFRIMGFKTEEHARTYAATRMLGRADVPINS